MQRSNKEMPLKPFLSFDNSSTLSLTDVSSQNTSQGSYWVKMSLHKAWQSCKRSHAEEKGEKSCYWRLVRVWKYIEYLMEELHCEAVLLSDFGTLQGVQTSCSLGLFLPVIFLYFFLLTFR